MALTNEIIEAIKPCTGASETLELGELTATMITRYAEAIGEGGNRLYHDREFARESGYADLPAPLNLLPAVITWGTTAEEKQRADREAAFIPLTEVPLDGLLVMGGGEEMIFHRQPTAGSLIRQDSELIDVSASEGKKGLLAVLRYKHEFHDHNGLLLTTIRTLLVR